MKVTQSQKQQRVHFHSGDPKDQSVNIVEKNKIFFLRISVFLLHSSQQARQFLQAWEDAVQNPEG